MDFKLLLKTWLLLALGVTIAAHTASGIHYDSGGALVVAVLLLSFCNVVLKPLLMLFSLPFIILTFGIGIWLINALLFMLVGALVEGFHVLSFWNALWGALVVSLTGAAANLLFGTSRVNVQTGTGGSQAGSRSSSQSRKPLKDDDDVIDI
ncbi:phage holin family protein [Coraliomargarita sinensis]|uniref:Phage holin family protein n=1 Tax=Coraliomargarita sinensis TaxID=2174842 RepID=A0A317ZKZ6_9BACT|nr:phage holin family protein [Coraliomargarita sinensis]PXA05702.1 phage holin family protein [Coraliomargarita sinensis]